MKTILALCCLMFASFCWGVTGGSTTTYSKWPSVTDLEGGSINYLATLNAWKAMPAKTIISVSPLGGRIYVLDSGGCVFTYDRIARTYTQKSWGCGWSQVTADFNPAANYFMVGLLKADAGCPSATQRFYWSYNEAAPGSTGYCASQWYGSGNHSQLQVNRTGTPSGHTWYYDGTGAGTYHDVGTSWFAGGVSPIGACLLRWDAVTGGNATRVYFVGPSGTATLFSPQPPLTVSRGFMGGFTGCTINNDVVVVTDGTKSYMSDITASTTVWKLVTGAVTGIQGDSKGTLFGIVSGNMQHLNVFAGYISATLQSTYTGCPDDTHPCPSSGVTHTRSIQVTFPHGVNGNLATFAGAPTATNQVISWDASPGCDPIFGDFHDPECFVATGGGVHCSVVNNSIYQPPPAPTCHDNQCGDFLNQQVEFANTKVELADKTPVPGSCITNNVHITTCEYNVFPICNNTINPDYKPSVIRDTDWWPAWEAFGLCLRDTKNGVPTEPWRCFKGVALETLDTSSVPCTYNPN